MQTAPTYDELVAALREARDDLSCLNDGDNFSTDQERFIERLGDIIARAEDA